MLFINKRCRKCTNLSLPAFCSVMPVYSVTGYMNCFYFISTALPMHPLGICMCIRLQIVAAMSVM